MPPLNETEKGAADVPIPQGKSSVHGVVVEVDIHSGNFTPEFYIEKDGVPLTSDGVVDLKNDGYRAVRFANPGGSSDSIRDIYEDTEVTIQIICGGPDVFEVGDRFSVYIRGAHGDPPELVLTPDWQGIGGGRNPTTLSERVLVGSLEVIPWVEWYKLNPRDPNWNDISSGPGVSEPGPEPNRISPGS